MTVKELITELEKMPQDRDVVMFDGPAYYTPYRVCMRLERRYEW